MTDIEIQYPWALLLFLLIPAVLYGKSRYAHQVGFSAVRLIGINFEPGIIKKYGIEVLGILIMAATVLAVANFRYSSMWQKSYLESKWIMIVQDLSGSMNRQGGEGGQNTLGDEALRGAREFIAMRQKGDLIGVIAFSSYAKLVCPPTFDKEILELKLDLLSRRSDSIIFRELTVGGATNASYAAWLALSVFFMLLPEDHQLSFEELDAFRYSLLGKTLRKVEIPEKLKSVRFGHGMAIVLFTDGRIEANKGEEDIRKGLPNFVNVVQLIRRLGVKLYLIVVGEEVSEEVRAAVNSEEDGSSAGEIFYMPDTFDAQTIGGVYRKINEMEKNKLLVELTKKKKETRWLFATIALGLLALCCFLRLTPQFRRI